MLTIIFLILIVAISIDYYAIPSSFSINNKNKNLVNSGNSEKSLTLLRYPNTMDNDVVLSEYGGVSEDSR